MPRPPARSRVSKPRPTSSKRWSATRRRPEEAAQGAGCEAEDLHAVGGVGALAVVLQPARGAREDLEGPGHIQNLDVGVGQHGDAAGAAGERALSHGPRVRARSGGDNDTVPTFSAILGARLRSRLNAVAKIVVRCWALD